MYKLNNDFNGKPCSVSRLSDGTSIPFDKANTDYQEFVQWCEQGNTPIPADESV